MGKPQPKQNRARSRFRRGPSGYGVSIQALRPLLIALAAGVLVLLGTASPAAAKTPCWRVLINDWYDGRIDGTYPASCYRQAIANAPEDIKTYSSLQEDLERALQASTQAGDIPAGGRGRHGAPDDPAVTGQKTTPAVTTTTTEGGHKVVVVAPPTGNGSGPNGTPPPSSGLFTKGLDSIGPKNATSVPLPLIILAAIALLLLAAGAAGFIARRIQTRRQNGLDGSPDPSGQGP
jgi:hypothetical protein